MAKRALIVDDSKTARQVLSGKLKKYGILVDTRESAAAAIDYLYEEAPDAIFMDYEMPGMDGFQALKVIKSNPNTALIPVMMYTSKAGGLALSQARALGAVGVLPKQLEPQDFEEVLFSLHLMPDQESLGQGFHDEDLSDVVRSRRPDNVRPIHGADKAMNAPLGPVSLPLEDYQQSLSGDGVRRSVRRELGQAEERLQTRQDQHFSELHAELFELEAHQEEASQQMRRIQLGSRIFGLLILILLGLQLYALNRSWESGIASGRGGWEAEVSQRLTQQEEQLGLINDQLAQTQVGGLGEGLSATLPLGLLEWAANQGTSFDYGEMPFNDERAIWLSELVEQLRQAGFRGTVELRAHYGNFCLKKAESGELGMADPGLGIDDCLYAEDLKAGDAFRNNQSVAFANYLNVELARSGGEVEILLFSSGYSDPLMAYPNAYEVKSAGEWNRIARLNQRLRVSLYSTP